MFARFPVRWKSLTAAMFIAGLSLCVTPSARGQFGEAAGIAEAMTADVMSRDIVMYAKALDLDETQRVIIEALFADYDQAFEAAKELMKQRFEEMRKDFTESDSRRVIALVFQPFDELGKEKAKIYEQFLNNVKVVLNAEQMERWPAFERELLREKEMHKGRLSGESIDLIKIVRDMKLDESTMQAAQPVLEEYDVAIADALRSRKNTQIKIRTDMLRAMSEQDGKTSMALLERVIDAQLKVRDVNDVYIERIAAALPADVGQQFQATALERGYPRVYRETPVQRLYTSALDSLEDLSPTTTAAITELQNAYNAELATMNRSLLIELRRWDPIEQQNHAMNFASHMQGDAPKKKEDPTRDAFLQRDEMGKRYAKSLQALLTPEQFGLLPGSYRWVGEDAQPKAIAEKGAAEAAIRGKGRNANGEAIRGGGDGTPPKDSSLPIGDK